ncbi:hypothetical protein GCM10009853_018380 [Glycomyces scopariae]
MCVSRFVPRLGGGQSGGECARAGVPMPGPQCPAGGNPALAVILAFADAVAIAFAIASALAFAIAIAIALAHAPVLVLVVSLRSVASVFRSCAS